MADRNLELALKIKALVNGADSIEQLSDQLEAMGQEVRDAQAPAEELGQNLQEAGEAADRSKDQFAGLNSGLGSLTNAFQALAGLAVIQQFVEANQQAEVLRNTLTSLTGSSEKSAEEIRWLTETANRLGVGLKEASESYINLAASAKGTALEGEQTRQIFEAVVGAMTAMGKSGADAENALTAIAQMMSKGVVSAEELRGQLGEALPGASQALARALQITTSELDKLVSAGGVVSSDVLPALAQELKKTYGIGAEGATTFAAQMARLQNAVTTVFTQVGDSGAFTAFKEVVIGAAFGVTTLNGALQMTGTFLGALAAAIATLDFSQFNDTMEQANQKVRAQAEEVAKYSSVIGPAFGQASAAADQHAGALDGITAAGQKATGSLTKLQFAHQQAAEAAALQAEKLNNTADAIQKFGQVYQTAVQQTGDYVRQLKLAVDLAEQDAKVKRQQADSAAIAEREAQRYYDALKNQINVMPAVLDAAEKDIVAKHGQADAAAAASLAALAQADAVKAANTVFLAQLEQQGMSAAEAKDQVAQLRNEYEQLRASGAGLTELANKMNEVVLAEDAARAAAKGYREELAMTAATLADYKQKLDEAKTSGENVTQAQLQYNTALNLFVDQQQTAVDQLQRRNQLQDQGRSADIAAVKAAADLAQARGDEAEATRLQIKAGEMAVQQARDRVVAIQAEIQAMKNSLAAAEQKALADQVLTQAEQAQLQALQDSIAAKQIDLKATEASVVATEADVKSTRAAAQAKEDQAAAAAQAAAETERAAKAEKQHAEQVKQAGDFVSTVLSGWAKRLNELSPAARQAFDGFQDGANLASGSLQDLQDAANRAMDNLAKAAKGGGDGWVKWANDLSIKALSIEQSFINQRIALLKATEALTAYAQTGQMTTTVQQAMIKNTGDLAQQYDLLDQQDLGRLRAALDSANAKLRDMQDAAQDARDRLAELNAEIAQERGDTEAADRLRLELEQRQALAELEAQLAEARNTNNRELIALYEEQKRKLQELYDLKERNLRQSQQEEQQRATTEASDLTATSNTRTSGGSSGGGVSIVVNAPNAYSLDPKYAETLARQISPYLTSIQRRLN